MLQSIGLFAVLVTFLLYPCEQLRAQEPAQLLEFRLAGDNDATGWQKMEVRGSDDSVFVSNEVSLHGGHIEKVSFYKDLDGNPSVGLTLTQDGAKAMEATTSRNLKRRTRRSSDKLGRGIMKERSFDQERVDVHQWARVSGRLLR